MKKNLLDALEGNHTGRPTFWFFRQAGRYLPEYREIRSQAKDFLHFCYTPKLAVEATHQPIRRYGMDAAILFSDILVVPDALGVHVRFEQGEGPKLETTTTEAELAKLSLSKIKTHLSPVYETVATLKATLPADKTLIGFSGSPWTLACYMVEGKGSKNFEKVSSLAYQNPIFFDALITLLTEAVIEHLSHQIDAGADVVQLFDSWAGAASPFHFSKYITAPTKEITARLKAKYLHVPVMGFPRGAGAKLSEFAQETKVDAVSIDQFTPLTFARNTINTVIQGNLDPLLLAFGTKDQIIAEAKTQIETLKGKAHIFNLGHGIIPATPPENVEALCTWLKQQ